MACFLWGRRGQGNMDMNGSRTENNGKTSKSKIKKCQLSDIIITVKILMFKTRALHLCDILSPKS